MFVALVLPSVCIGAPGDLYVTSLGSEIIMRVNPAGEVSPFVSTGSSPSGAGLAFDNHGNLYVSDPWWKIDRYDSLGQKTLFAAPVDKYNNPLAPNGLEFGPDGLLYSADIFSATVTGYSSGGGATTKAEFTSGVFDIAFDPKGDMFVAGDGKIFKVGKDGIPTLFANPQPMFGNFYLGVDLGIAFDAKGNLYTTFFSGNLVMRWTPDGVGSVFANSLLNAPNGIAIDSSGMVYVANQYEGTIVRFDQNGTGSIFASGLVFPGALAFEPVPVPEPSFLALILSSIGSIVVYRRRSSMRRGKVGSQEGAAVRTRMIPRV